MVYVVIHEVEYLDKYLMIKHTMLNIFKSIKNDAFFFRNLDVIINLTWKKPNSKCAYITYCALCNLSKSKLNYFDFIGASQDGSGHWWTPQFM